MNNPVLTAALICPAPIEYKICCDILRLSSEMKSANRTLSSRIENDIRILAVHAGPGKIQCASASQYMIDQMNPDIVIDVGGAGSLDRNQSVNDIICAKYAYEFDICPVEEFSRASKDLTTHTIVPVLNEEGLAVLREFADWIQRTFSVAFLLGDIASGERNVDRKDFRERLHQSLKAIACNWETSAVLKTAELNHMQSLSFRVLTDQADENMRKDMRANWEEALQILCSVLKAFLFNGWLIRILRTI